jgi:ABC-type amino acid transport substrate-binding protein
VTKNEERAGLYGLTKTYTWSEGVVAARADETSITSLADLKGKKSAQSLTSNWAQVAKEAGAEVESVEGFTQAVTLLKQKRVDATINDNLAVLEYQKATGDQAIKVVAKTGDVSEQVIATRKDSDLVAAINTALDELAADGTLKKISEKYFSADVSVKP